MKRQFSEGKVQIGKKHVKRCSNSLGILGIKVKTTMKCTLSYQWTKLKRWSVPNGGGDVDLSRAASNKEIKYAYII